MLSPHACMVFLCSSFVACPCFHLLQYCSFCTGIQSWVSPLREASLLAGPLALWAASGLENNWTFLLQICFSGGIRNKNTDKTSSYTCICAPDFLQLYTMGFQSSEEWVYILLVAPGTGHYQEETLKTRWATDWNTSMIFSCSISLPVIHCRGCQHSLAWTSNDTFRAHFPCFPELYHWKWCSTVHECHHPWLISYVVSITAK